MVIFTYNLKLKGMTKGFKELLRLAKEANVKTYDELQTIAYRCVNEITGADLDSVRRKLNIRMF
jgi:hypothetical protein